MRKFGLNLSYIGAIKDEILDEYTIAFNLIKYLYNNYRTNLTNRYSLSEEMQIIDDIKTETDKMVRLIETIGLKRGAVISGGKIDEMKASRIILEDFRSGKLGRITLEKMKG